MMSSLVSEDQPTWVIIALLYDKLCAFSWSLIFCEYAFLAVSPQCVFPISAASASHGNVLERQIFESYLQNILIEKSWKWGLKTTSRWSWSAGWGTRITILGDFSACFDYFLLVYLFTCTLMIKIIFGLGEARYAAITNNPEIEMASNSTGSWLAHVI